MRGRSISKMENGQHRDFRVGPTRFLQVAAAAGLVAAGAPQRFGGAAVVARQLTASPGQDTTTSDILVETLIDWGATRVFGIVGDGINSIIESLRKRQERIRYVAVRHEEGAAMASGRA
jgi:pyruvate dehydrogenase (quinone)/pyruvate decarboxylase